MDLYTCCLIAFLLIYIILWLLVFILSIRKMKEEKLNAKNVVLWVLLFICTQGIIYPFFFNNSIKTNLL